jgi:hypothetical protein
MNDYQETPRGSFDVNSTIKVWLVAVITVVQVPLQHGNLLLSTNKVQ